MLMQPKVGTGFGLPEGSDGWTDWTWFHAKASVAQRFTILCSAPANYSGHYRKGRMVPCVGDACPLCAAGIGAQARYVVSVVDWETRRVGLFEMGRGHAVCLQDWAESNGGLRGLTVEVQRVSQSKQSRMDVRLVTDPVPLYFQHLQGPDVARAVRSTWERQVRITLDELSPEGPRKVSAA
jgi:hypothetical protein